MYRYVYASESFTEMQTKVKQAVHNSHLKWISFFGFLHLKECSKVHISLAFKKADKIDLYILWPFIGDGLKVTGIGSKQGTPIKEFFFSFPM